MSSWTARSTLERLVGIAETCQPVVIGIEVRINDTITTEGRVVHFTHEIERDADRGPRCRRALGRILLQFALSTTGGVKWRQLQRLPA